MGNSRQNPSSSNRKRRHGEPSSSTEPDNVEEYVEDSVSNEEVEQNIARGLLRQLEQAPPGYQFAPTDDELIDYLRKKKEKVPMNDCLIHSVNIYSNNGDHPKHLTAKHVRYPNVNAWYFFTPRQRKYENGKRPTRKAGEAGFWKATGALRPIEIGTEVIGHKQALVFYEGDPNNHIKTRWNMQEYITGAHMEKASSSDMRLDDWVLCRVSLNESSSSRGRKGAGNSSVEVANQREILPVEVDNNLIEEVNNIMALVVVDDHPSPIDHNYHISASAANVVDEHPSPIDHNYHISAFAANNHRMQNQPSSSFRDNMDHQEQYSPFIPPLPTKSNHELIPAQQTNNNQFGNGYLQNQENNFPMSCNMVEDGSTNFPWESNFSIDDMQFLNNEPLPDLSDFLNETDSYIHPSCSEDLNRSNPPAQG